MQWLLPVGVVLTLLGLGGAVGACYQSTRNLDDESSTASAGPDGGVPADRSDGASLAPMVLGPLAGLFLACGVGCIAVGMGHWNRPVASSTRPANPWSEQPRDKGEPPVGLV
jgi:hypothetical protein